MYVYALQTEEADIVRHNAHKHDKKQKKKSKDHRRSRSFGPGDQLAVRKRGNFDFVKVEILIYVKVEILIYNLGLNLC